MTRRGSALIAVLWVLAIVGAVVGAGAGTARLGNGASANRVVLTRGRWAAEACLAIAEARWVDHVLADSATVDLGRSTTCTWSLDDPTSRLNVNVADSATLRRFVLQFGVPERAASMFVDTVLTLRQTPLTDMASLVDLPGYDARSARFVTFDGPGTVNANAAAEPVLEALPGMTREAAERLVARRTIGRPINSVDELAGELSPAGRATLVAAHSELSRSLTFAPPQLVLTAKGWVASVGLNPHATIELVVVPLAGRLAVVRRRMW
jgi:type II secretory pathway component PulK